MKSTRKINEYVRQYFEEHEIKPADKIIIAYSGGPDSTVLLSVILNLTSDKENITAAWFDHGLRSDTEMSAERENAERVTSMLGVRLISGAAGPGCIKSEAESGKLSVEEAARLLRYRFLAECADNIKADYIATGHNLNDNTETMLMRFFTNAGIFGLSGIPDRNGKIIRPLSRVSRAMIENYLGETGIAYCIDKTNLKSDFMRNRVRNEILPLIRDGFPDVDKNLYNLSKKFEMNNTFLNKEAADRLKWHEYKNGYRVAAERFYAEDLLLRVCSVFSVLNKLSVKSRIRFQAVEKSVEGRFTENGKTLLKTREFELVTADDHIFIRRLVNHNKKSYLLYLEPEQSISIFGQTISVYPAEGYNKFKNPDSGKIISLETEGPVIVRSHREGDGIETVQGKKSLKKIFNEWKVIPEDRDRVPVIEAGGSIRAVAGEHLGYKNRIASDESNLREEKKIMLIFSNDTETIGE